MHLQKVKEKMIRYDMLKLCSSYKHKHDHWHHMFIAQFSHCFRFKSLHSRLALSDVLVLVKAPWSRPCSVWQNPREESRLMVFWLLQLVFTPFAGKCPSSHRWRIYMTFTFLAYAKSIIESHCLFMPWQCCPVYPGIKLLDLWTLVWFLVIEKCQKCQMNTGIIHALAFFIRLAFKRLKQVRRIRLVTRDFWKWDKRMPWDSLTLFPLVETDTALRKCQPAGECQQSGGRGEDSHGLYCEESSSPSLTED